MYNIMVADFTTHELAFHQPQVRMLQICGRWGVLSAQFSVQKAKV